MEIAHHLTGSAAYPFDDNTFEFTDGFFYRRRGEYSKNGRFLGSKWFLDMIVNDGPDTWIPVKDDGTLERAYQMYTNKGR